MSTSTASVPTTATSAPRFPLGALLLLSLAVFVTVTAESLPAGLLPEMVAGLQTDPLGVGLLISVWALTVIVTSIPLARLTARFDRRLVAAGALAAFAVANAATALAPTYEVAVATRIAAGVAHGLFWAIVIVYATSLLAPSHLGRGLALVAAGGTVVLTPGGEIYAALERGVIDASEWIGPHDDMKLGLHTTARYYYYPGWHEPGTTLEFGFNRKAYEGLPVDLRHTLDHAVAATQMYGLSEYEARNAVAVERLRAEFKGKVEVLQLPVPALRELKKLAAEVVREESGKSPMAQKVYASYTRFQAQLTGWGRISEGAYQQFVAL